MGKDQDKHHDIDEIVLDGFDIEEPTWEPLYPADGVETCTVCLGCFGTDVDPIFHPLQCRETLVSAKEEPNTLLIEVAIDDLGEWFQRRAKWLSEQVVCLSEKYSIYRSLTHYLLDMDREKALRKLHDDPLEAHISWLPDTHGES